MNSKDITSYEIACKELGLDPDARPDYSKCNMGPKRLAYHNGIWEADIILMAMNRLEDGSLWKPHPTDAKHYVWKWIKQNAKKRSGFGLSFIVVNYDASTSRVASRLVARTREIARDFFELFPDLNEDIFIRQDD